MGRTESTPISGQHTCSGQTLQHKPKIFGANKTATGHCPQVRRTVIRGGVELQEQLLKGELPESWQLAEIIVVAAGLELGCDAELAFDDTVTIW